MTSAKIAGAAVAAGLTTLWIANGSEQVGADITDGIEYWATDLGQWLHDILREE